jgi:hypothetical protein
MRNRTPFVAQAFAVTMNFHVAAYYHHLARQERIERENHLHLQSI